MALNTNLKSLAPRRQTYQKRIKLPSNGLGNPKAWPDGSITVYPWDSQIDEFLLEASRKAQNKMTVLFDVLAKVVDLNGANVDDFLLDEVDIGLLVSRAAAQDGSVVYTSLCPFCGNKSQETIVVPDQLEIVSAKPADYPGYDTITLPDCKDIVKVRPLRVKDERIVLTRPPEDRVKISDNALRAILRIVSVNDSKADSLAEWYTWFEAISPKDVRFLDEQSRELAPHLNTNIPHLCANVVCGREFKHRLTFDQDFFR